MNNYEVYVNVNQWGEQKKIYAGHDWNEMIEAAEKYTGGWKNIYYKLTFFNCGYEIHVM